MFSLAEVVSFCMENHHEIAYAVLLLKTKNCVIGMHHYPWIFFFPSFLITIGCMQFLQMRIQECLATKINLMKSANAL